MDIFRTLKLHPYWHHMFVIVPAENMSSFPLFVPICRGIVGLYTYRLQVGAPKQTTGFWEHIDAQLLYMLYMACLSFLLFHLHRRSYVLFFRGNGSSYHPMWDSMRIHSFLQYCISFWNNVCNILLKGGFTLNMYILTSWVCFTSVSTITLVGYVPWSLRVWESITRICLHHLLPLVKFNVFN